MIDPTDQLEKPAHPLPMRVALAHDWLVARRGGELVLDAIAHTLAEMGSPAPHLFTMFDAGLPVTDRIDALDRTVSKLNTYPAPLRRWLLMSYPSAVESLSRALHTMHQREPIDLLISTSSAAIKSMRAPRGVPHLCYCHTPARYLWSQTPQYTQGNLKARIRGLGLALTGNTLRNWDTRTADRVDRFIANSTHTQNQIREHYGRDSAVIHPPVRTDFFTPDTSAVRSDSLLLVSALEPYKRIDLAIDAAMIANRTLTIVGTGSHESTLRTHAQRARKYTSSKGRIVFLGKINDEQLRDHYRTSWAFLFPQIEDFGITAVEAQACACPVIAYRAGGALDTVLENQTGVFFDETIAESLADAIARADETLFDAATIRTHSEQFSEKHFRAAMSVQIRSIEASV